VCSRLSTIVALTFVALTIVPFLLLELWFFVKATREMGPAREEPEE